MKLVKVIRHRRADEQHAKRNRALAKHVRRLVNEFRYVALSDDEIEREREHDGEQRRVQNFPPVLAQ